MAPSGGAVTESGAGDTLDFRVIVPPSVRQGEAVAIQLTLTNVASRPIEVHLQGRETVFDVVVIDGAGTEVWRRLRGASSLAILQLRTIGPGESLAFAARWNQTGPGGVQVLPGTYRVHGELPSDAPSPLRTAAVALEILPAEARPD
jgi:hypothetical protein